MPFGRNMDYFYSTKTWEKTRSRMVFDHFKRGRGSRVEREKAGLDLMGSFNPTTSAHKKELNSSLGVRKPLQGQVRRSHYYDLSIAYDTQ